MAKRRWWMWSIVAVLMLLGGTVLGAAHVSGPAAAQEKGRELVVYNQDLALVKDTRNLNLTKGVGEVIQDNLGIAA